MMRTVLTYNEARYPRTQIEIGVISLCITGPFSELYKDAHKYRSLYFSFINVKMAETRLVDGNRGRSALIHEGTNIRKIKSGRTLFIGDAGDKTVERR